MTWCPFPNGQPTGTPADDWGGLLPFFCTPSHDYPEICIHSLTPEEVAGAFELFRGPQVRHVGTPVVHDRRVGREVPLSTLENPVELVHQAAVEPFHFLVAGLRVGSVVLPDLGVFILPQAIALDFSPGFGWTAASLEGLLRLVDRILLMAAQPRLSLEEILSPAVRAAFLAGLERVRLAPAANPTPPQAPVAS